MHKLSVKIKIIIRIRPLSYQFFGIKGLQKVLLINEIMAKKYKMKNLLIILALILFSENIVSAQYKEYNNLTELYNSSQFEKCIQQALKYNAKESGELNPVLFCSKSYFELFKTANENEKLNHLKNSLKFASKIKSIDKKKVEAENYNEFLEDLHKSSLQYGNEVFNSINKEKSKPIFDFIVKIFLDTTLQYLTFHPDQVKKTVKGVGINIGSEKVNQTDINGLKQGFWTKVYPNGVLAYQVNFKDDKPVGVLKRFHENGKLMAHLQYDEIGEWADAKHYDDKEQLIAEGKYHKKLRHGLWLFYMEGFKVAEENYSEGFKSGTSKTYYKNGQISEEKNWEKDVENGVWRQYFPSGKVKLETRIEKGIRNSVYYVYYENGTFEIKGHYKDDRMNGDWFYYNNQGVEIQKINYVMGKTDQQKILDEKENEIFKKMEGNKNRLIDPADYMNNPNEYLQKNGLK